MADKNVNLIGTRVMASTIADFYNRLNALRQLNGGETTVSFSAPSYGALIQPQTIQEARDAVLATKSALSFLATVDISQHEPIIPSAGDLIEAQTTAHPIEWQIGQLENACFAYFGSNRLANRTANFNNFNLADVDNCSSFFATNKNPNYTTNYTAQYTGFFATQYTTNYTAQYNAFRATNFTAQRVTNFTTQRATNFTAQRKTNFTAQRATNFTAQRVTNFTSQRRTNYGTNHTYYGLNWVTIHFVTQMGWNYNQYFSAAKVRFGNSEGCAANFYGYVEFFNTSTGQCQDLCSYFCTNYYRDNFAAQRYSNFSTNYGANYAAQYTGFFATQRTANYVAQYTGFFATQRTANYVAQYTGFFATNFTAQRKTNFTAQRGTNFTTQRVTNFTTQYSSQCTPQCSSNYGAVKNANNVTNNSADNAADFTAVTTSYYANHGTFTVTPL